MINGVLIGYAIILISIPIPVVHFIAVPLSPFVAGFIGGGVAKTDEKSTLKFGLLMALLMSIPGLFFILFRFIFGIDEVFSISSDIFIVILLILIPYTWFGSTIGALISYIIRKNQDKA
ncbi:MAG: DUF5518 domain-containing protein [Dehalococcoidia bacterium]